MERLTGICIYRVCSTPASNKPLIPSHSLFLFAYDGKISSCPSNPKHLSQPMKESICFQTFPHCAFLPVVWHSIRQSENQQRLVTVQFLPQFTPFKEEMFTGRPLKTQSQTSPSYLTNVLGVFAGQESLCIYN